DLVEGDMLFPAEFANSIRGVAARGSSVPWTKGIVPYEILPGYASTQQAFIIATMQKMERLIAVNNYKCIQFRPRIASDIYYITIVNGQGCASYVGQNTGVTMARTVTLQHPGCIGEAHIMHELLHALGFYHEQSRPDRDDYVRINYANIQYGMINNFDKYTNTAVDTQNTPYDYKSVMHYEKNTFSVNGLPTIEPLVSNVSIGQRDNMSLIDIQEVRLFYNCSAIGTTLPPIPTTTTRSYYYRERYSVIVPVTDSYVFTSVSSIDTYGQFYSQTNPSDTYYYVIAYDDDSGENKQFKIQMYLQADIQYLLIVTTSYPHTIGSYTLVASGLYNASIQLIPDNADSLGINANKPDLMLIFFLIYMII
ncbi:unnamed protein product, partial [Adineta steineri]